MYLFNRSVHKRTKDHATQTDCDEVQTESEDNSISHGQISGDDMDTIIEDIDTKPDVVKYDMTQAQQHPEYASDCNYLEFASCKGSAGRDAYEDNSISHRETSSDDIETPITDVSDLTQPPQYPEYVSTYDSQACTANDGCSERDIESEHDDGTLSAGINVDDVVSKNNRLPLSLPSDYISKYDFPACTALDGPVRDIESDNDDRMTSVGKHVDDVVSRNDSGSLSLTSECAAPDGSKCDVKSENDDCTSCVGDYVDDVVKKKNAPLSLLSHLIEIKPEPVDADDLIMDCCSVTEQSGYVGSTSVNTLTDVNGDTALTNL